MRNTRATAAKGRIINVLGVILAGGRARRMGGGDKPLLPLGDATVLDYVMARFAPQVPKMALNANGDPARFSHLGLPVLPDRSDDRPGPLAGVLAGLDWAAGEGADAIVTVAGDTPFFPPDLVAQLVDATGAAHPIALAATPDPERGTARHPTFGLWPVRLRDDLAVAIDTGTRKIVAWTDRHGAATVMFETAGYDPFFNLNTPEDRTAAEALLQDRPALRRSPAAAPS